MPTQLEIVSFYENMSVTESGKVINRKVETTENIQSLWQDYGEARCMACGKDVGGAYVGLKKHTLQLTPTKKFGKEYTQYFSEQKAKKYLEKAHITADSLGGSNTVDNLLVLCKRCHIQSPDTSSKELFWVWGYNKIKYSRNGTDSRDLDKILGDILQAFPEKIPKLELAYHGEQGIHENAMWNALLALLSKTHKEEKEYNEFKESYYREHNKFFSLNWC